LSPWDKKAEKKIRAAAAASGRFTSQDQEREKYENEEEVRAKKDKGGREGRRGLSLPCV